jgi:hypothetical protein
MAEKSSTVTLTAVGDIGFRIEENNDTFDGIRPFLKEADINLGQLEALLSGRGARQVHFPGFEWSDMTGPSGWRPNPEAAAKVLASNGFDILSFASNHSMDMGDDALFDTLDILEKNNIAVIGAGKNIEEARRPVILERKGTKVGFLAYCTVVTPGSAVNPGAAATKYTAGVAPMRATTYYEPFDQQPGYPAQDYLEEQHPRPGRHDRGHPKVKTAGGCSGCLHALGNTLGA